MTAITCHRPDLRWALAACLPHVARGLDTTARLHAVRLELEPGTLYAVATDRYTLGCAAIPVRYDGDPATALIAADDARELVKRLARRDDSPAVLELYEDGDIAVDYRVRYSSLRYPGPWRAGQVLDYPDWRTTLSQLVHAAPAVPGRADGLNPEYLGRFTCARRPGCASRALTVMPVASRGSRADAVVLGEWFAGAVASTRLDCSDYDPRAVLADWRARLPEAS